MHKSDYISRGNLWLFIAVSAYFVMNGAQLWETALFIPSWSEAPPVTFNLFISPYHFNLKAFWIAVHSIHDILLIWAMIFNWKLVKRRNWMVVLFIFHMAIRIWTISYFAPQIIEFQSIAQNQDIHGDLVQQAQKWVTYNYIRVGLFFAINIAYALQLRKQL